jgi:hypothetical protein
MANPFLSLWKAIAGLMFFYLLQAVFLWVWTSEEAFSTPM